MILVLHYRLLELHLLRFWLSVNRHLSGLKSLNFPYDLFDLHNFLISFLFFFLFQINHGSRESEILIKQTASNTTSLFLPISNMKTYLGLKLSLWLMLVTTSFASLQSKGCPEECSCLSKSYLDCSGEALQKLHPDMFQFPNSQYITTL